MYIKKIEFIYSKNIKFILVLPISQMTSSKREAHPLELAAFHQMLELGKMNARDCNYSILKDNATKIAESIQYGNASVSYLITIWRTAYKDTMITNQKAKEHEKIQKEKEQKAALRAQKRENYAMNQMKLNAQCQEQEYEEHEYNAINLAKSLQYYADFSRLMTTWYYAYDDQKALVEKDAIKKELYDLEQEKFYQALDQADEEKMYQADQEACANEELYTRVKNKTTSRTVHKKNEMKKRIMMKK